VSDPVVVFAPERERHPSAPAVVDAELDGAGDLLEDAVDRVGQLGRESVEAGHGFTSL
jgi:hypothetical protein